MNDRKKQHSADWAALGMTGMLVPPGSKDFSLYGGGDTVDRAREWALDHQYLLYRGPAGHCVHGLYRMDCCSFPICNSVGLDHTQVWVQSDARGAFLLTHPYAKEIRSSLRSYAAMHGLRISTDQDDGWYGHGTLPIRMTIPDDWPLWPIERDAALLLHVEPISWPGDES